MKIQQIKILLQLLKQNDYQGKIGEIKPNSKTIISVTEKLCYQLYDRELIEITEKNQTIICNEKSDQVTNNDRYNQLEQKILQQCQNKKVKISTIKITPASKRDLLIEKLAKEKLITITDKKITHVKLVEKGQQFLAEELLVEGLGNITLFKPLLNYYLTFIRNYFQAKNKHILYSSKTLNKTEEKENIDHDKPINYDDVLQVIKKLDRQLNTDNYLPIFHLRNYYQQFLSRQELDNIIFTLQKKNKISLSRLVDASQYTAEEYQAGIPQSIGYPIFYLIVKE